MLVVEAVGAAFDFVSVDRRCPQHPVLRMREGMPTQTAFIAARRLLTYSERDELRAMFGGPTVADAPAWILDDLCPFIGQSWLNPETVSVRRG